MKIIKEMKLSCLRKVVPFFHAGVASWNVLNRFVIIVLYVIILIYYILLLYIVILRVGISWFVKEIRSILCFS